MSRIRLTELWNNVERAKSEGLIPIDDWKLNEVDYLTDMGFHQNGDYEMEMRNPNLKVYKKKKITHEISQDFNAIGEGFVIEDKSKNKTHTFPIFKSMIEFFDNYSQDFDDE